MGMPKALSRHVANDVLQDLMTSILFGIAAVVGCGLIIFVGICCDSVRNCAKHPSFGCAVPNKKAEKKLLRRIRPFEESLVDDASQPNTTN